MEVKRTLGILNSGSLILYLEPAVIASFGNRQMFIPGVEGFPSGCCELKIIPNFQRKKNLLVNFREPYKIKHSVRRRSYNKFLPRIQNVLPINNVLRALITFHQSPTIILQWAQTGRRHSQITTKA